MKKIPYIIISILALQNFAFPEEQADGWMWVQYPWSYSFSKKSWVYMQPIDDSLWFWHMSDSRWELKPPNSSHLELGSSFENLEELEAWAAATAYGGYSVNRIDYSDNDILIVSRSFTWGLLTNDVSIFIERSGSIYHLFHMDTIQGSYIEFETDGSELIIKALPSGERIFSLNLDFCVSMR